MKGSNRTRKDDALDNALRNDPELLRSMAETVRDKIALEKMELENQRKAIELRSKEVELNASTASKAIEAQKEVLLHKDNSNKLRYNWAGVILTIVVLGGCLLVYNGQQEAVLKFSQMVIPPVIAFFGGKAVGENKAKTKKTNDSIA